MYILQNFYFPQPEGHTETFQLTYVPQVLAEYIQYQYILDIYWIYMSVELTNIPKLLAAYSIQMYISPSRAPEGHWELFGRIYPYTISIYIFNLLMFLHIYICFSLSAYFSCFTCGHLGI